MAVNPTPHDDPPAVPPPVGSRWQVIGFDWNLEVDRPMYAFVVTSVSDDGWAECLRDDNGQTERRFCGGTTEWRRSESLEQL